MTSSTEVAPTPTATIEETPDTGFQIAVNDIGSEEAFLAAIDKTIKYFNDGDIVEGTIVKVDRDEVLLDIGYKTEGVIPSRELSIKHDVDPSEVVSVGDAVEALVLQKFRHQIRDGTINFLFAHDGVEALAALKANGTIDLVVTDINMPRMDGLSLLQKLQESEERISTIIVSAYGDMTNIRIGQDSGNSADAGGQPAPSRQRRLFAAVAERRHAGGQCRTHHGMSQDIHGFNSDRVCDRKAALKRGSPLRRGCGTPYLNL